MIRHRLQAFLEAVAGGVVRPVETQKLVELVGPFRRQEWRRRRAIGHIRKRVFPRVDFRPQRRTDMRGHAAVDTASATLEARPAYRERSHVELLTTIDAAQCEKLFFRQAELFA